MLAITRRWRRGAAAIGLAVVVGLVGGGVSWALWNDTNSVADAELHSGTVVLLGNGSAATTISAAITPQLGAPATTYVPITISNAGTLPLSYRLDTVTAAGSDPALYTTGLTVAVGAATSVANCQGGAPGTAIPLTTGTSLPGAAFVTRRPLAAGAAEVLCVSLTAPAVTNPAFRTGSAQLTFRFHGQNT